MIILCIGILSIIFSSAYIKGKLNEIHLINPEIDKVNELKQEQSNELDQEIQEQLNNIAQNIKIINEHKVNLEYIDSNVKNKQQQLDDLQRNVTNTIDNQKKLSQVAFENYCDALIKSYEEKEKEYNENLERLNKAYADAQEREMNSLEKVKEECNKLIEEDRERVKEQMAAAQEILDKIRATRDAALKAQSREKEIKENNDNFRLKMSEVNLKDINLLKSIQPQITNSIVIDKIIWSNYYQPIAKARFPQIIGKPTTCGIYKLTDLNSGLAYIGQSVDICDR